jgi:hypothetical protein
MMPMEYPELGSIWRHYNGCLYKVLHIANLGSTSHRKCYPVTIVYINIKNANVYTRAFSDWHRSMSFLCSASEASIWDNTMGDDIVESFPGAEPKPEPQPAPEPTPTEQSE